MDASEAGIRIEGLVKDYAGRRAVAGLDLEVAPGEFLALLGPNGAGKTTTLKCLVGLLRPTSGRISVGGLPMDGDGAAARAGLGYIPDRPWFYPRLTGREYLDFVAGLHGLDTGDRDLRAAELGERFGLGADLDRLVDAYSLGMRQRLAFIACFLTGPRAVVIDEPWAGMDPRAVRQATDFLRERAREGLAVLMSTHSLALAERVADRAAILHRGRRVAYGTLAQVRGGTGLDLEEVFLELTRD
ncbi:MAG: ABC transporter ATP-binding protein [Planctomycetes bacterium]|nr:ABC transporter ATP-binding protein [Planctomycetota bacterium]